MDREETVPESFFRLDVPEIGLSIQQNTEDVPRDGKFHIMRDGAVVASYPSLKRARDRLQKLKEEAGYQPQQNVDAEGVAAKEHVERLMDAASSYWSASHRFRGGGGKGGRGGI